MMRLLLLAFPLLLAGSCNRPLAENIHLADYGEQLALQIGESMRTERKADDLFTFVGVVEDSRCPRGTNCIWAGQAVVSLLVLQDGQLQARNVTLDGSSVKTDRGALRLLDLKPYPEAGVEKAGTDAYQLVVELQEPVE